MLRKFRNLCQENSAIRRWQTARITSAFLWDVGCTCTRIHRRPNGVTLQTKCAGQTDRAPRIPRKLGCACPGRGKWCNGWFTRANFTGCSWGTHRTRLPWPFQDSSTRKGTQSRLIPFTLSFHTLALCSGATWLWQDCPTSRGFHHFLRRFPRCLTMIT